MACADRPRAVGHDAVRIALRYKGEVDTFDPSDKAFDESCTP